MKQSDPKITGIKPSKPIGRIESLRNWIEANYDVSINIFDTTKSYIRSKNIQYENGVTEQDIYLHMIDEHISCTKALLRTILTNPNQMNTFNPILDYFNNLEGKFKGKSMIDIYCNHIKAHEFGDKQDGFYQERLAYIVRKWMVATVASVFGKHCNDVMFGFVNAKGGIGKSTLVHFLCPECLEDYWTISDNDDKLFDMSESFATKFIINFDEFVGIRKSTANTFKKNMSLSVMDRKLPGKSFFSRVPRIASCAFTSNNTQEMGGFLFTNDSGLLRRIAAIEIDDIDISYSDIIDLDQMWAEALLLFQKSDLDYIWNRKDFESFCLYNQRYVIETCATRLIKEYYRQPLNDELPQFRMASEVIKELREAHKIHSSDRVDEQSIGQALKTLGFERAARRTKNGTRYGYYVIPTFNI